MDDEQLASEHPDAFHSRREFLQRTAMAAGLTAGAGLLLGPDVVIGEAMLTMQSDAAKHAIVAEAARVLRPRGRYAIHELALTPDDLPEEVTTDVRQSLARAIKVNARPLTVAEWSELLGGHGLVVRHVATARQEHEAGARHVGA